jgi:hypothetical protein
MMNSSHGPAGCLSGLAGIALAHVAHFTPDTPTTAGWLAGATAGALLPDADHPSSTPSRMWGPLTSVPASALGRLAGGHREGTHDVSRGAPALFAAAFAVGLAAPAAYHWSGGPAWLGLASRMAGMTVVALLVGLTLSALHHHIGWWAARGPQNFAASWMVAAAISTAYPTGLPWQVTTATACGVAIGCLVGGIGLDACTLSGVPWRGRKIHLLPRGWRIRTSSPAEARYVRAPILVGIVLLGIPVLVG